MNAVEKGRLSLAGLLEATDEKGYDCTCQVGGVDAMSIDTDYLRYNMELVSEAFQVMDAATDAERLTESNEFVRMARLVDVIKQYAEQWSDPDSYVHEAHDKTFLAGLILATIGEGEGEE